MARIFLPYCDKKNTTNKWKQTKTIIFVQTTPENDNILSLNTKLYLQSGYVQTGWPSRKSYLNLYSIFHYISSFKGVRRWFSDVIFFLLWKYFFLFQIWLMAWPLIWSAHADIIQYHSEKLVELSEMATKRMLLVLFLFDVPCFHSLNEDIFTNISSPCDILFIKTNRGRSSRKKQAQLTIKPPPIRFYT